MWPETERCGVLFLDAIHLEVRDVASAALQPPHNPRHSALRQVLLAQERAQGGAAPRAVGPRQVAAQNGRVDLAAASRIPWGALRNSLGAIRLPDPAPRHPLPPDTVIGRDGPLCHRRGDTPSARSGPSPALRRALP